MGKHIALVLVAAAMTLSACAEEPDYYEGELVPTRPIRKPSLDPNAPAELTGGQVSISDTPTISGDNKLGAISGWQGDRIDGRISWADEIETKDGATLTVVHEPGATGFENVTIIDEFGATVGQYQTRYQPDRSNVNLAK